MSLRIRTSAKNSWTLLLSEKELGSRSLCASENYQTRKFCTTPKTAGRTLPQRSTVNQADDKNELTTRSTKMGQPLNLARKCLQT